MQIKLQKKIYNLDELESPLATKPQSVARIWIQKFFYTFWNLQKYILNYMMYIKCKTSCYYRLQFAALTHR